MSVGLNVSKVINTGAVMIKLKSDREIDEMKAGALAFELLDLAEKHIKPGVT